jgi:hypothetical protein
MLLVVGEDARKRHLTWLTIVGFGSAGRAYLRLRCSSRADLRTSQAMGLQAYDAPEGARRSWSFESASSQNRPRQTRVT